MNAADLALLDLEGVAPSVRLPRVRPPAPVLACCPRCHVALERDREASGWSRDWCPGCGWRAVRWMIHAGAEAMA